MAQKPGPMTDGSHAGNGADGSENDAEQLQRQIAGTRASMGHTLDAIQERMNPRKIVNRTMESVKEKTATQMRNLADTATSTAEFVAARSRSPRERLMRAAQRNPGGAVLVGAAALWVLVRAMSGRGRGNY